MAYALLDATDDSALLIDSEGIILAVNSSSARRLGKDRMYLLGTCVYDYLPEGLAQTRKEQIDRVMITAEPMQFKDIHSGRNFVHTAHPVLDELGEVVRVAIFAQDITDSSGARDALKQAEKRYRNIFENAVEGIFQARPNGRVTTANPAFARILGYDSTEQLLEVVTDFSAVCVTGTRYDELLSALKKEGSVSAFELRVRRPDEAEIWISLNAHAIINRSGQVTGFEGVIMDISTRKGAEEMSAALANISETINSTLDFDEIMKITATEATRVLGCESAGIALRENQQWVMRVTHRMNKKSKDRRYFDEEMPHLALAALTRKPVTVNDAQLSAHRVFEIHGLRSFLAVPMMVRDEVVGVMSFNYHSAAVPFSETQVDFALRLAASVSLAVDNARLYQNELADRAKIQGYATQLSALHDISLSLNRESDPHRLLDLVLGGAAELTFAGSGLMAIDLDSDDEIIASYRAPWNPDGFELREGPATLRHRISHMVATADWDAARFPEWGLMAAAIRDPSGEVRGYIVLSNKGAGAQFTHEDEEILTLLANQSSVALVSAEKYEREHRIAEVLQAAMLPDAPLRRDMELGLVYQSAGPYKVGGDFYDFVELAPDRIVLVLGDVCGKGLDAATYTAMIKYMLRAYLGEGLLPGDCLTRLNRAVYEEIAEDKFITVSLALIDSSRRLITHAGAGHPRPALCQDGQSRFLPAKPAVPLGVVKDYIYTSSQTHLAQPSSLLMYTDGLIEARPAEGDPYGETRLLEALTSSGGMPAQNIAEELLARAVDYSGGNLRDDIALVALRPSLGPAIV
jgi:PAS domain S-box-containing protein